MNGVRYPETAFAAGAILSACERGDFERFGMFLNGAGDPGDSGEQERRELIEEIASRINRQNWGTYRSLLGHLAVPPTDFGSISIH